MSRTLVIQTAWLGDVVLTTPLLAARAAADGPVDVLVTPDAAPLVETHPAVRAVLTYDKRGRERGAGAGIRLARRLRAQRYRQAVLAQSSLRSGLLALAAGIPERIGFAGSGAAPFLTDRRPRTGTHEAERLLRLADTEAPSALRLALTPADYADADAALRGAGIAAPFVALAPGSARPNKRWPYYGELASRLLADGPVVLVGTKDDGRSGRGGSGGGPAERPAPTTGPPARRSADLSGLPIRISAAILSRAAVVVANDSAPLHLAQAVGTPVVALFGPTHTRLGFGPRGPLDRALGVDLPCRPCSTHGGATCPLDHHRCLRDLSVAIVSDAVRGVLTQREVSCA